MTTTWNKKTNDTNSKSKRLPCGDIKHFFCLQGVPSSLIAPFPYARDGYGSTDDGARVWSIALSMEATNMHNTIL